MDNPDIAAVAKIGFTDPSGQRWLLVGSHTSTTRVDSMDYPYAPRKADNCEGCGTKRKAGGSNG